jgi:hypothetical protein
MSDARHGSSRSPSSIRRDRDEHYETSERAASARQGSSASETADLDSDRRTT